MRWSYKTIHFELKKEGLLGGAFLDVPEIEQALNEYGRGGWELVSLIETGDGLVGVLKQPIDVDRDQPREEASDSSALTVVPPQTEATDLTRDSEEPELPAELPAEVPEEAVVSQLTAPAVQPEAATGEQADSFPEANGDLNSQSADPVIAEVAEETCTLPSGDEQEIVAQAGVWEVSGGDDQDGDCSAEKLQSAGKKDDRHDEQEDDHDLGVGAIRIE